MVKISNRLTFHSEYTYPVIDKLKGDLKELKSRVNKYGTVIENEEELFDMQTRLWVCLPLNKYEKRERFSSPKRFKELLIDGGAFKNYTFNEIAVVYIGDFLNALIKLLGIGKDDLFDNVEYDIMSVVLNIQKDDFDYTIPENIYLPVSEGKLELVITNSIKNLYNIDDIITVIDSTIKK